MKIRPMMESDRPVVQEIINSTGIFTTEEERIAIELIDTYLNRSDQSEDYEVDVVENSAGTAAGFICYGPTPLTEGTMDLYWLAVHAGSQKQGLGQALFNWLEKVAVERKTRLILIETSSSAPYAATRRFYERMGYPETARVRDFYRPGDDRIIYCKYFPNQGLTP
ncbi:MAG: GNAT family N-acetyltransferase [Kiritimatiellia bacterium]|nr:GNAT family N-acetyltransferase [Kiritimatiellia bacterium]